MTFKPSELSGQQVLTITLTVYMFTVDIQITPIFYLHEMPIVQFWSDSLSHGLLAANITHLRLYAVTLPCNVIVNLSGIVIYKQHF